MCFANLLEGMWASKRNNWSIDWRRRKTAEGLFFFQTHSTPICLFDNSVVDFRGKRLIWFSLKYERAKTWKGKTWLTAYCYFHCDNELNGRFIDIFIGIYGKAYFKVVALIIVNVFKPFLIKKTIIFKSYCNVL